MKKITASLISFIIILTIIFTGIAPTTAMALEHVDSESTPSHIDVPVSNRYHVIENGYRGKYALQEGVFGYQTAEQENKNSVYFYSDGYFEDSPEIYNSSLSSMSLALALSGFNTQRTDFDKNLPSGLYSNLFRHARVLMSDIGIEDKNIYVNDDFTTRPTEETIGMIMGAKEIFINDEKFILVPIAVRGGDYESEWSSNFTLGTSGEAFGFSSAADKIVNDVKAYLDSNTSFDFASALNNGRVKFWVVGYSRGGAVANITSKRLTEDYGQAGNSIYGYCFEAPAGGVDSAVIKQPWTYEGIYSNIHNIINTADLVPRIPPKEMGFKRYGIDHFVPGTDSGEITSNTYITPTGITVTTYADNEPLEVGSEAYNERREKMVENLAEIDDTIVFSDSFSLVKLDFFNILSNGEIFSPVEMATDVTTTEWLDALASDLQNWAANGTYSYGRLEGGGYNNDFRHFYTTHTKFAGKNHVTLETALRCILKLAFTHYEDQEFLNALLYRSISLTIEYASILDLYLNLVQKWDNLPTFRQHEYLDRIWEVLDGDMYYADGTPVKKISDFVDDDEKELLEHSFYTLSSFLFLFTSKDHDTTPQLSGVDSNGLHIVTLIHNVMTVAQGHYPEVCLSWLRTYDSNYSIDGAKYIDTTVTLNNDENNHAPKIEYKIDIQNEGSVLSLSTIITSNDGVDANSKNNGSSIYYAFFDGDEAVTDWELYQSPIVLDSTKNYGYSLIAFAVRFEEMGTMLELSNEELYNNSPSVNPPENEEQSQISTNANTTPLVNNNIVIIISSVLLAAIVIIILVTIFKKRKKK